MITIHTTTNSSLVLSQFSKGKDMYIFPEIMEGRPLSPNEIVLCCPEILTNGKPIVTVSEHIILFALMCIGKTTAKATSGESPPVHIGPADIEISFHFGNGREPQLLRVDGSGEFIDRWPNGFFNERASLLFY